MTVSTPSALSSSHALDVIARSIHRTPVMTSASLNAQLGLDLTFKCEHLQRTGSFKFRGASFAVALLPDDCPGVATHSSGNHGAALAAAAAARGMPADIVMPDNAVPDKIEAVRAYGGTVHLCRPTQVDRERGLAARVASGRVAIPPYDHDHVIAGQGTVALELIAQAPQIDCIVAPIGGGGLLAGCVLAAARIRPDLEVIGAEPNGADDALRSLAAGARVDDHEPRTIADGLRALVGRRNLAILARAGTRIVPVDEADIVDSMHLIWRHLKQVVEPSGAVALAALRAHRQAFANRRVGVILSGGNLALSAIFQAIRAQP